MSEQLMVRCANENLEPYNKETVANRIFKSQQAAGEEPRNRFLAEELSEAVQTHLQIKYSGREVSEEEVHESVQRCLVGLGYVGVARHYLSYLQEDIKRR